MKINWSSPLTGAIVVGGGFITFSLFLFWCAFDLRTTENSISSWRSFEGRLINAEIIQDYVMSRGPRLRWLPKVSYTYTVDGKNYEGFGLFWGRENSSDREVVEGWLIRTLGPDYATSIPRAQLVYYNPDNPSQALLDNRNYSDSSYGAFAAGVFFLLTGIFIAFMFVRKARVNGK